MSDWDQPEDSLDQNKKKGKSRSQKVKEVPKVLVVVRQGLTIPIYKYLHT